MDNPIESAIEVISSECAFSVPDRGSRRKWDGPWWQLAVLCEMGEGRTDSPVSRRQRVVRSSSTELGRSSLLPTLTLRRPEADKEKNGLLPL